MSKAIAFLENTAPKMIWGLVNFFGEFVLVIGFCLYYRAWGGICFLDETVWLWLWPIISFWTFVLLGYSCLLTLYSGCVTLLYCFKALKNTAESMRAGFYVFGFVLSCIVFAISSLIFYTVVILESSIELFIPGYSDFAVPYYYSFQDSANYDIHFNGTESEFYGAVASIFALVWLVFYRRWFSTFSFTKFTKTKAPNLAVTKRTRFFSPSTAQFLRNCLKQISTLIRLIVWASPFYLAYELQWPLKITIYIIGKIDLLIEFFFNVNTWGFMSLVLLFWLNLFSDEKKMRIASVGLTGTALLVGFVNIISIKKNELSLALLNSLLETERLVDTVPQTLMFTAGFDGLALVFVMLTLFSFPLLLVSVWNETIAAYSLFRCLLMLEIILIISFSVTNILYFYVAFEALLIPMIFLISGWTYRDRKIKALYYFFLYTLCGSLAMLFGIIYFVATFGTGQYSFFLLSSFEPEQQALIWICFGIAFAVKLPMFPFHLWLPEAHVEAPTVGSMLLAGLLLKLGGYGFLRFSVVSMGENVSGFTGFLSICALLGTIIGSFNTIIQSDFKRVIAYSSVAHMNLTLLGICSATSLGLEGALFLMVGHGLVSAGLFFCVGFIYKKTSTRLLRYYGGFFHYLPLFTAFFLFFTLSNMGFPGTCNFPGELMILTGIYLSNPFVACVAAFSTTLAAVYSVWLFNRVIFGTTRGWFDWVSKQNPMYLALPFKHETILLDVKSSEVFVGGAFAFFALLLGVATDPILSFSHTLL